MLRRWVGWLGFAIIDWLSGSEILPVLKRLEKEQFDDPAALKERAYRDEVALFERAKAHTRYYRQFDRFENLPEMTKTIIREQADALLMDGVDPKRRVAKNTSGTTGQPTQYYNTALSRSFLWAGILMAWRVAGHRFGDPVCFLAGAAVFKVHSLKDRLKYRLMGIRPMSAFHMTEPTMDSYLDEIAKRRIRFIYGYSSAIQLLARHAEKTGFSKRYRLTACISTAEMLTPVARKEIERGFACPVYNQYGANDAGIAAYECERRQGMHFIISRAYPEINRDGELLSTDLTNDVMPLLRCNVGDQVRFSDHPCPCGRGYPLIVEVIGRSKDGVWMPDGRWLQSNFFIYVFYGDHNISRFQVFQRKDYSLEVRLETVRVIEPEKYRAVIAEQFGDIPIKILVNEPFIQMANGKVRTVFTEIER